MPIQGFVRFREHQVGSQTSLSSNSAATRVLPYRGPIEVEPNREQPDVDEGSLDPILAPFAGAKEVTGSWEGKLAYNDAPYLFAGLIKSGVTPTGATAKSWAFQAASLTADGVQLFVDQWGDDVTTDWINAGGGTIDSLELGFDEDLGAWDVSADLIYANADLGGGPTGGLTVDSAPTWVYGADTEVYLDTAFGSIGSTKLDGRHPRCPVDGQQQPRPEAVRQRLELAVQPRRLRSRSQGDRTRAASRQDRSDHRRAGDPRRRPDPGTVHRDQGHESRDHHRLDAVLDVHPGADAPRHRHR